jgi:hypothetical protein
VVNLCLAVFWLVVAAALFALPPQDLLKPAPWRIPNTDLSMGWFALCLCVYNLVRAWTTRRASSDLRSMRAMQARRRDYDDEAEDRPGPPASGPDVRYREKPPT